MSSAVQKVAKPQLRGLFRSYLKKHLSIAIVLAISASVSWKFLVMEPRKRAYAEFYKTYDGEKDYERMKDLGVIPEWPQLEKRDY